MNKTILLFASLGFLAIWVLEFRRVGLADSYWLILLAVISALIYQYLNISAKAKSENNRSGSAETKRRKPSTKK